ncbi:hypothetical protein ACFYPB_37850 [Streptomyces olivaceoviridis]|uniref:hypothetical protein n=1 Tax=Streptomyces olivaceoviridis TaxID=1921 RepID=UPI0036932070
MLSYHLVQRHLMTTAWVGGALTGALYGYSVPLLIAVVTAIQAVALVLLAVLRGPDARGAVRRPPVNRAAQNGVDGQA